MLAIMGALAKTQRFLPFDNGQILSNPLKFERRWRFKNSMNLTRIGSCFWMLLTKSNGLSYPVFCRDVVIVQKANQFALGYLNRLETGIYRSLTSLFVGLEWKGCWPA
jgi:hypothetical protein